MKILRKYQLDIIFLFFAEITIVGIFYVLLKNFGADPHDYEWFITGPLILFFVVFLWQIRNKINIHERRALTNKTLIYWIALGVTMFLSYSSPISARDYITVDIFFIIFTLFLADSYWDFKKLSIRNLFLKKNV